MIPLRLTLHNFMCYRDPDPLDFTGLHLVCLAGNNGHGKSALLDAVTWALWGKARSNSPDDLIHLGQDEMWVDFEFVLGSQRYRVLRSRRRKGRSGKSDLQFQVWDGEWRPLTEPTIRETEQRIVALLRMDYETFINSAFLVQGRADEFTIKPPGQRKQILADILGLSVYDTYEERAKQRARERREEAGRVEAQMAAVDQELAREEEYKQALEQAQREVSELSQRLRVADQELQAIRSRQQQLLSQRQALADLEQRLKQAQQQLAEIEEQLVRDRARLAEDQALLAERAVIEQGYQRLQAARQAEQEWSQKLADLTVLQAERNRLSQQISAARSHLEAERHVMADQVARLEAQMSQIPQLEEQVAQAQAALGRLQEQAEQLKAVRAELQTLAEEKASLEAQNQRLKEEMDEIKRNLDLLSAADAACPVCGRPLADQQRQRVLDDYRSQGKERGDQYRTNRNRLLEIQEQMQARRDREAELERALQAQPRWQGQVARAEAHLAEAREAQAEIEAARARLEAVDLRLAQGEFAPAEQARLARIEQQIAAIGYDAAAHAAARQAVQEAEPFQERHVQLQAALERQADLQTRIQAAEASRQRWQKVLEVDQARQVELVAAVAALPAVAAQLREQATEVERLEKAERLARERLGAAQQRLDACQALRRQRQSLATTLSTLREQQALYEELQAAFSKKGLQAMIIEAAIPELEAEANRLLSRMTDGRMAVRLETQRETKTTQELRETLDIIISDELGSRDYALFSGGEAFRANFAIRVALSKLLARRAGARLQTLIIDEGFGSQDAQGRERLVEAINSIRDDFERILVITHIEELKELFPARIEVVKTADGSQITVS